jgi:hypothetical protein
MYVQPNLRTKKALRQALADEVEVTVFQPGPFADQSGHPLDREVSVEGPHYPEPHRWYARVLVHGNVVVKVIS